ncbi:MAG: tetratricopeptide repeat protein [Elusimicrobiota bacterium]
MRYLLISLLFAGAVPVTGQTASAGADKDIRLQTPAELVRTAAELEKTLIMQPDNVELHIKLGFTYTRLGKADEAQRFFENAARLDPKMAIVHFMLGLIYEKKGLKAMARTAWQSCLETAADPRIRDTALKHLNTLNAR